MISDETHLPNLTVENRSSSANTHRYVREDEVPVSQCQRSPHPTSASARLEKHSLTWEVSGFGTPMRARPIHPQQPRTPLDRGPLSPGQRHHRRRAALPPVDLVKLWRLPNTSQGEPNAGVARW